MTVNIERLRGKCGGIIKNKGDYIEEGVFKRIKIKHRCIV